MIKREDVPIHQLLFSTLRIEAQTSNGTSSVGTGFIVLFEKEDKQYLFLVTNKHVIKNSVFGKFFFTVSDGKNPQMGKRFDISIENFESQWFCHPAGEDVAVMPFFPLLREIETHGVKIYFKVIPLAWAVTKEQENLLTAFEEVIFIGYPSAIYDTKNLLPIIRRGTTATPLYIDYEGKPLFLIDASVFPGSSGSPVFIYNQGTYFTPEATKVGIRTIFLGILSQFLIRKETGSIEIVEIPTRETPIKFKQPLNLGVVLKACAITETIEELLRQVKK